jgi:hypothetical protein
VALHRVRHRHEVRATRAPRCAAPRAPGSRTRIRCAKDTGLDHFPSRSFAINQAWLTVVTLAVDLIAWTQHLLLHGDLAKAEPKMLRYRLLHVAARLTHGQRRLWMRIQRSWPWAHDLAAAFTGLGSLPVPAG